MTAGPQGAEFVIGSCVCAVLWRTAFLSPLLSLPSRCAALLCRLLEQLGGDPLLARLLRAQNQRLHEMAEQGLDHPAFHSE